MGVTGSGSLNSSGYSAAIAAGRLPAHTHLTYQGLFNELRYSVGSKTDKVLDLHHGYARLQFVQSKFDSGIHDYLALFLKGKADGQPRDPNRRLNSVICLDISGSMTCSLGSSETKHQSRLSLCIEAIKMFISKLHPQDSVGMTTFDDTAHLIFEPIAKKNIDDGIYERLDEIKAMGNNQLIDGFNLSKSLLLKQMEHHQSGKEYENRVVILSDVCDNSIHTSIDAIKDAASKENIHLTIVGISTGFNSKACEELKDTVGFNYFSAVNEQDILKYMFETFDYTFFPSANQAVIQLQSDSLSHIEVYGTPDATENSQNLPNPYQQEEKSTGTSGHYNSWEVTRMKSCFPSEIEIDKGEVFTVGGLVLVKLHRKDKGSSFKGKIILSYKDILGTSYCQDYDLYYQFHPEQQFVSSQLLRQAISGFIYTSEMKTILKSCPQMSELQIYSSYYKMLCGLEGLCPKRKLDDYKSILKIVQGYNPNKPQAFQAQQPVSLQTVKEQVK